MKVYTIAKGTPAIVITSTVVHETDGGGQILKYDDGRAIKTTKDLDFMDTILDPVRLHNIEIVGEVLGPIDIVVPKLVDLVRVGYALFRDEDHPNYILAVEYDKVEILA